MQNAETVLSVIRERGRRGLPLERIYRHMFNRELYLLAYGRIYRNNGAMTPGVTPETVDGMSLAKIDTIIELLRYERYRWTPVRRVSIEKKHSTKKRPLGLPTWSDKLVQEVIRLILDAYYEPQFSPHSHGFRPGRGCHTALSEIYRSGRGTAWFIEGDISACFDSLDHQVLRSTLAENIHDNRFLRLIDELLKAGYLEDWKYNATRSGAPQGSIVSPILSNIYLDRFDTFVETVLFPMYNRGTEREANAAYTRIRHRVAWLAKRGRHEEAAKLRKHLRSMPSRNPQDPTFRRLRYVRYADDFLLGFCGPQSEALEIKRRLGDFLRETLKLELSESKTLITHARTATARFLGYDITVLHDDRIRSSNGLRINGTIGLRVPMDVIKAKCRPAMRHGKAVHRMELTNNTAFSIVAQYQQEYRGIVEYYRLASNLHRFRRLKWVMEQSLTKTLARKFRISVPQVYDRFQTTIQTPTGSYKGLVVKVERAGKPPLETYWGGISLQRRVQAVLDDVPKPVWNNSRSELVERLLADVCELCGASTGGIVHHIRHLKDLRRNGRAEKPYWVRVMAARWRKSLVVCKQCHNDIHAGRMDSHRVHG